MSRRMIAAVVAAPLVAVLLGAGGVRAAAVRHLPARRHHRRARRRTTTAGDHPGRGPQDLPRRRRAADDHGASSASRSQDNSLLELMSHLARPATTPSCPTTPSTRRTRRREQNDDRGRGPDGHPRRTPRSPSRSRSSATMLTPLVRGRSTSTPASPADGSLVVRDLFLEVGGKTVKTAEDVGKAVIQETHAGGAAQLPGPLRDNERTEVSVVARAGRRTGRGSGSVLGLGLRLPVRRLGQHQSRHRRTERGPDVLAGHLRHADARLADRRPDRGRHRRDRPRRRVGPIGGIAQKIARRPRRGRRAVPGAARPTARTPRTSTTATCSWCSPRPCTTPGWPSRPGPTTATPTCPAASRQCEAQS